MQDLSVCCIACYTNSSFGVKPSGTAKLENSPSIPFLLFLSSFSCTPQQGSLLHFTSYKIHPPPLLCCLPALYRKLFPADMGVCLARNGGKKVHFSSGYILRAAQLLHALVFFSLFFFLSSCSVSTYFILSFFFLLLSTPILLPSPMAPYGATACVTASLGAILYCCIVV